MAAIEIVSRLGIRLSSSGPFVNLNDVGLARLLTFEYTGDGQASQDLIFTDPNTGEPFSGDAFMPSHAIIMIGDVGDGAALLNKNDRQPNDECVIFSSSFAGTTGCEFLANGLRVSGPANLAASVNQVTVWLGGYPDPTPTP